MAFICTVNQGPAEAKIHHDGQSSVIHIAIGRDETENLTYFVVAGLDPLPPGDVLEFWFHIAEADGRNDSERIYWSGLEVSRIFSKEDRGVVLSIVLFATKKLLDKIRPDCVFVCTHDGDLPPKALGKYDAIGHVFSACGYKVTIADPYHGKRSWWMERRPEFDVCD